MNFLSILLLSTLITIALIPICRRLAIRMSIMDLPDERKVHNLPVPTGGGLAMAIGAFIPVLFQTPENQFLTALAIGTLVIVSFGILDDFKGLSYKKKLVAQTGAALIMILYGGVKINSLGALLPEEMLLPDWISIPLTLFVIVGVINAINLSDGLDGLAGGICLLIFMCIGYLAYRSENTIIAVVAVGVVGSIFGFLRFNTYPATLFMGDTGSQFLGFLAAALSLKLTEGNTPLSHLLPLILLGFPILDTLYVMMGRLARGRSPFVADKNHFHHKLMGLGLYHTEAVVVIYLLQALLVTSAFIFRFYSEWFLLLSYLIFCGLILSGFFAAKRTDWRLKRTPFIDKTIKGRLRFLKEKNVIIIVSFRIVQIGVPVLMFLACLLATGVYRYLSLFTLCAVVILLLTLIFVKEWLDPVLRVVLYLVIPFVIYLSSSTNGPAWIGIRAGQIYNVSFAVIALFTIFTLRFTRRKSGFRTTPMDFLILFVALIVPNIPDPGIRSYHMGLVTAKIIVLFFSYDILMGELRGNQKWLCLSTIGALLLVSVKGFL